MTELTKEQLKKFEQDYANKSLRELVNNLCVTAIASQKCLGRDDIYEFLIKTAMQLEVMIDD